MDHIYEGGSCSLDVNVPEMAMEQDVRNLDYYKLNSSDIDSEDDTIVQGSGYISDADDNIIDNKGDVPLQEPPKKKIKQECSTKAHIPSLTKRAQEPPLPRPLEIPSNFPNSIASGLAKKKLTGKPRSKFITIIAQSIYRYKSYPTEDEYLHVAQELVKKWSFLDEGKGPGYILVALRMRMAYLRKPEDKKRGNPDREKRNPAPPQKAIKPSTGTVPMLPTGEDDASQQRHLKLLQAEMKKVNPNKHIIRDLMTRTNPTRRQEILEDRGSVNDVLKAYPALKYPDEIICEFNRVMEDIGTEFMDLWGHLIPKILDLAEDDETVGVKTFLGAYSHREVSPDYRGVLAMGYLSYMTSDVRTKSDYTRIISILPETANVANEASQMQTSQPCLVVRATSGHVKDCFLMIEKKMVGKVQSVDQAILVLFASFYAFNVHYPLGCCNFYVLLECLAFKRKLPGRKPRLAALLAELSCN